MLIEEKYNYKLTNWQNGPVLKKNVESLSEISLTKLQGNFISNDYDALLERGI